MRTKEDYEQILLARFDQEKNRMYSGQLLNISRADLRDILLIKAKDGLKKSDEQVVRTFLGIGDQAKLIPSLENMRLDRFRALINFLEQSTKTTDTRNLNLLAILLDFEPRPFNKFNKEDSAEAPNQQTPEPKPSASKKPRGYPFLVEVKPRPKWMKRAAIFLLFGAVLIGGKRLYNPGSCMQWQVDHYESVDCKQNGNSVMVYGMEEEQFGMKRERFDKDTKLMSGAKPNFWYARRDGKYELFNQPGHHPIDTDRELRPVSRNIAMKIQAGEIVCEYN